MFSGFATWWIPYLYLWTILWGVTMLLPQKMPKKVKPVVYMIVNASHGFLFGAISIIIFEAYINAPSIPNTTVSFTVSFITSPL